MWWNDSLLLWSSLTALLLVAGRQDWRTYRVSNNITIPLLLYGVIGLLLQANPVAALMALLLTVAALRGWMGGADWKVLVGLFGLWPEAGAGALLAAAGWGLIEVIRTRDRNARFPGVAAYALGAALTYAAQVWYLIALN